MGTLGQDVRYGLRILLRSPGFSLVVVLILALGIGGNTAIFTMTRAVLMSPLPFDHPERLMHVMNRWKKSGRQFPVSGPEYLDWVEQNTVFEGLSALTGGRFSLTGAGDPLALTGLKVTPGFFRTLGAPLILGREFLQEEAETGRHQVTVLSHRLWKDTFGGDPRIVGRRIVLDGAPWTVVGVAKPTMGFIEDVAQLYVPLLRADLSSGRTNRYLTVLGRLKSSVSAGQAQAQMDVVAAQLARQNPDINPDQGIGLSALQDILGSILRKAFFVLHGAVALVLLIACANVSNLLLARAGTRRREIAVRCALGAKRGRVIRQMLTESLLLGLGGGCLGLILACWALGGLKAIAPRVPGFGGRLPGFDEIRLDSAVLAFTVALSMLTAAVFGLLPAWRTSRCPFRETLAESGSRASAGLSRRRMLGALVVSQIALALVLLTGSGLLIRSFARLARVNPGFVAGGLLAAALERPDTPENRQESRCAAFYQQVVDRLADLPGVESACAIDAHPLGGADISTSFGIRDETSGAERQVGGQYRKVTDDYFRCLRIPLVAGRFFAPSDRQTDEKIIIVNREFIRRNLPEGEPLGKTITHWQTRMKIVGVVGDVKLLSLGARDFEPTVYEPIHQTCGRGMTVLLRTARDPMQLADGVRRAIRDIDPAQPILRLQTMRQVIADSTSIERFCMILFLLLGSVAWLMAVTGIYSVAAFAVNERRREIGIRMAFGAERSDVLRLIIRRGAILTTAGLVVGLAGAVVLMRGMSSLLYQTSPTDPLTLAFVSLLLGAAGLLACYLPARRAARIDPMAALRYE